MSQVLLFLGNPFPALHPLLPTNRSAGLVGSTARIAQNYVLLSICIANTVNKLPSPLFPGPHPLVSWLSPLSNLFPTQQQKCGLKTQFISCHSSALNLMQLLLASRGETKLCTVALGILQNLVPAYFFILIECHLPLTGHNGFLSPPQICQLPLQGLFTSTFWNVLPPALTVMTPTNFFRSQITLGFFFGLPSPIQLWRLHFHHSAPLSHAANFLVGAHQHL